MKTTSKKPPALPQTIFVFRDGDPTDEVYLVEESLDGFGDEKELVGVYELRQTGRIQIGATAFVPHLTVTEKPAKAKRSRKR